MIAVNVLADGTAVPPLMFATIVLFVCVAKLERGTEDHTGLDAAPCVRKKNPEVPGANAAQLDAP